MIFIITLILYRNLQADVKLYKWRKSNKMIPFFRHNNHSNLKNH